VWLIRGSGIGEDESLIERGGVTGHEWSFEAEVRRVGSGSRRLNYSMCHSPFDTKGGQYLINTSNMQTKLHENSCQKPRKKEIKNTLGHDRRGAIT